MNAAIIAGFALGLAGVILQNAWYDWHRRLLRWLSWGFGFAGSFLLSWGAGMAHRSIIAVLITALLILAVAGSLAFVAFMAEVRHQGWTPVVKRMTERERKS